MRRSISGILFRVLFFSYLLSAVFLFILALTLYKLNLSESQTDISVYIIYALSCFVGGLIAGKSAGSRRFFWGVLSGVIYFLLLLILSILFQRGSLPESRQMMTVLACCLAGGTLGGIIS